jgi:hypothetical protein
MTKYRAQRYDQSLAENGHFHFGPRSLLLFGAASFLYELMPSGTHLYTPDFETISSFFGAQPAAKGSPGNATGGYDFVPERIPPNFVNRIAPYTVLDVATNILAMYLAAPRAFGDNAGVGNFEPLGLPTGSITGNSTAPEVACALYGLIRENTPGMCYLTHGAWSADRVEQTRYRYRLRWSSGRWASSIRSLQTSDARA